jgi:hypothetical protein
MHSPANRTESGRFAPGSSGNPNGRPRDTFSLRARCRELSPRLIEERNAIALDPEEPTGSRIEAAELIISYGHGKPVQGVITAVASLDVELPKNATELDKHMAEYAAMIGAQVGDEPPRLIDRTALQPANHLPTDDGIDWAVIDAADQPPAPRTERISRRKK